MARILLIIVAVILALLLFRWIKRQPANKRWQLLTVIVIVVLLALVLTGRLHWLFAFIGAMIPAVQRLLSLVAYLPAMQRLFRTVSGNKPSTGQTSQVETTYLRMHLDHDSGNLTGEVKTGTFAGSKLQDLSLEQLLQLYNEYSRIDEDSELLLGNYIDKSHGTEWRTDQEQTAHANTGTGQSSHINEQEAYAILGLEPGADEKSIIDAHRRLIQKLHPDRGGSSYLATKINQAKDLLLEKIRK